MVLMIFFLAQAVISKGMIYVSGNIGCDRNFQIVEGGVKAQTVRKKNMSEVYDPC